jgi:phospholipid/cholesterol/gamma-HCH transport system substrate-binding protein
MPRWLLISIAVALVGAWATTIALTAGGRSGPQPHTYRVELDNAFGLTDGSDVKLGGVRAGIIDGLGLDQRTRRAIVGIKLSLPGFDSMRRDAFCQVRPQSLIGEYFLDCQPGNGRALPAGGLIPVRQTGSAIGFDLLSTALRKPNQDRLRLLLGELGAGVASRGPALNEALRRALPALRETNRVLRVLGQENRTLADLVHNGDRALTGVDRRRQDVARFVKEAGDTARISARRRSALSEQWRRYPGFLDQLTPAMRDLGTASDAQAGALRQLTAGAGRLKTFFDRLGAFSAASKPAIASLGRAAKTGRVTAHDAKPALAELADASRHAPELAKNAAIVFEHIDDRANAAEVDPRSPGGQGYTGIEGLMQFIFNQSQAVNTYNADNYFLKVDLIDGGPCGNYADAQAALKTKECWSWLGPNLPGLTYDVAPAAARAHHARRHATRHAAAAPAPAAPQAPIPTTTPTPPSAPPPSVPTPPQVPLPKVPDLPPLPSVPGPGDQHAAALLDYLLGS